MVSLPRRASRRIKVFHDRFPLIGPIVWILSVQYFVAQIVTAADWPKPYSWANNAISDLGRTDCRMLADRYVCSPSHDIINLSFILLGIIMAIGSLLIYQEFRKDRTSLIGFSLMAAAGVGTFLVGLAPSNVIPWLHDLGAGLALGVGNISLVVLSLGIKRVRGVFRAYTFLTGIFSLTAFALYLFGINFGLGDGAMERLASYPQTTWLILFGIYMTRDHFRRKQRINPFTLKTK